jgi:3-hydroxyisobutyrate dehydrogenase
MPEPLAFIGYGEVGRTMAQSLRAAVPELAIAAWDLKLEEPETAAPLRAHAAATGVRLATTAHDAVRGAGVVISAVTAASNVEAAHSVAGALLPAQLFVDLNSVSPARKADAAARLVPSGAAFLDLAVMSPIAPAGHRTPMLAAGPAVGAAAARLGELDIAVEAVGSEIGAASAVKMVRSVMVKGIEAVMVECLVAAERHGVTETILESLERSFRNVPWRPLSAYMLERVVSHGARRAAEMREVAATLRELGLEPLMAEATAERQQWVADRGLARRFHSGVPEDRAALLAALAAAVEAPPS